MVDDIHDGHQLPSMGSERDVGNTADLNEAFEHLRKTPERGTSDVTEAEQAAGGAAARPVAQRVS